MFDNFLKIQKFCLIFSILFISLFSFGLQYSAADSATCLNAAGNYCMTDMIGKTTDKDSLARILGNKSDIPTLIGSIVGMILSLLGTIFLILIIYGGFIWMMAGGNDQNVEKAKNILAQAIIGLVIVLSAYAITSFIGNAL
jgi:hypothetical protein